MARPSKGERTRVPFNCPNDLLDRLDAWQKAGGASDRGAALQIAVERLLDPPATAPAMPLAHTPANLPRQAMPHVGTGRPADFGVKVNVDALNLPLASEVDRGPMQRTPKARPLGR